MLEPGTESWTIARLLQVRLLERLEDQDRAAALLADTRSSLWDPATPPNRLIRLAVTALAIGDEQAEPWVNVLVQQLGRIRPAEAGLGYLGDLAGVPNLADRVAPALLRELERTAIPARIAAAISRIDEPDGRVLALSAAEAARVAGHEEWAATVLDDLMRQLAASRDPFLMVRVLEARARVADLPFVPLDETRLDRLRTALAGFPEREGTVLKFQAQAFLVTDPDRAEELVYEAETRLARAEEPQTALRATVPDLQAEVGRRAGRHDAAVYLSRRADELRGRLGWGLAEPSASVDEGRPRMTIAINLDASEAIGVTLALPPPREPSHLSHSADAPLVRVLLGSDRVRGSGLAEDPSRELIQAITRDGWKFGLDVGSLALHENVSAIPEPVDIALRIGHRRLAAVPWELLRHPGGELLALRDNVVSFSRIAGETAQQAADARTVQRSLNTLLDRSIAVDGLIGNVTRGVIADFQRTESLAATGVVDRETAVKLRVRLAERTRDVRPIALIVRSSFLRQRSGVRGEHREGSDVAYEYEASGFQVQVLEDPAPRDLRDFLKNVGAAGQEPRIVHLATGITMSSGVLSLELGDETWSTQSSSGSDGELYTATALDKMLQTTHGARNPLVVLDVPRPPTATEAVRMLLLRNLFASDLFQLGGSSAIIATGIAGYSSSDARVTLLRPLRAGGSLADAVRAVRAFADSFSGSPGVRSSHFESPDGFPENLALASTVLFSHVPWMGIFPP